MHIYRYPVLCWITHKKKKNETRRMKWRPNVYRLGPPHQSTATPSRLPSYTVISQRPEAKVIRYSAATRKYRVVVCSKIVTDIPYSYNYLGMHILFLPLEGEPGVVATRLIQNNPLHIGTFMPGFLHNVFAKIGTTLCIDCIGAKQHKEGTNYADPRFLPTHNGVLYLYLFSIWFALLFF